VKANEVDVAVIGGGAVGLATAMALLSPPRASSRARARSLVVLEREETVAAHQTGHNSGVIHSGLYYKPGSLKATLCMRGRVALERFCEEHGVAYERCGKIVVATRAEQMPLLDELERRGRANGLAGVRRIGPEEIREYEPYAAGIAALHVAETGIVDYAEVSAAYAKVIRARGGEVRTGARVIGIARDDDAIVIETTEGEVRAAKLVACAGLHADRIARMAGVDPGAEVVPFRGEYYELAKGRTDLVRNLIYPVPNPAFPFLGVHFTRMIHGGVECGPNAVLALAREGYAKTSFATNDALDVARFSGFWRLAAKHWQMGAGEVWRSISKRAFVYALRELLPSLGMGDLTPAGAGVRAQALLANGSLVDDFHFAIADRMVHVLNAPSPAATASIAIGETIAARVDVV
jgi:L-2-hydroxyglutarate oxidase